MVSYIIITYKSYLISSFHTFLYHIRRVFLDGKLLEEFFKLGHDGLDLRSTIPSLQSLSNGIVAIGVLNDLCDILGQYLHDLNHMIFSLDSHDQFVHDADSELVQRELVKMFHESFKDVIKFLTAEGLNGEHEGIVPFFMVSHLHYIFLDSLKDDIFFFICADHLNESLHWVSAVQVTSYLGELLRKGL